MSNSNRFRATRKNSGTMTFSIADNDWKAMKILCDFYNCSPGELLAVLIKEAIRGYKYDPTIAETKEVGE